MGLIERPRGSRGDASMAEKERKPDDKASAAAPTPGQAKPAPRAGGVAGMVRSTPVLLGAVMLVEAGVLFAGFKFFGGGPTPVEGALLAADPHSAHNGDTTDKPNPRKRVELAVLDFKAPNKLTGRTFLYDVSIYLVTRDEHKDKVRQTIAEREATIKDRIRTIVAQSDPDKLGGGSEPGLETLRRQVKYQLDEILGEGMIDEVLIPRCIPYRADF
jgi:flagellar basal body-associated protein FliL